MTGGITRRGLLKATGVGVGGAVISGTLLGWPEAAADAAPWDQVPVILGRIVPPTFPDRTFDIRDYGAVGDGTTDCTPAFGNAIAACNAAGGGRVLVPGTGTFRTGRIELLSNVELHVAAGGTIRFRTDPGSYLPTVYTRWQGIECFNYSSFIYAFNRQNVAITGGGTIDGNAQTGPWFDWDSQRFADWDALQQMAVDGVPVEQRQFGDGHFLKPNLIQLYRCRNILIADVRLRNPAMWTIHPVLSQNVTVRNVSVFSRGAMVDGCDPECCADVHITGCSFDTGDDGTVIKSGRDIDGRRVNVPSENIIIENCDYFGRWGAVTVGSEMSGGVRNVFAQDCRIHAGPSYHSFYALYIKTNQRRGGYVDGVHVRRISGGPCDRGGVFVDMNYSLTGPGFGPIVNPVVRNIHVERMTIDDSPFAIRLSGLSVSPISHFHMIDCAFTTIDTPAPQISNAVDVVFTNVTVNGQLINSPPSRYEAENATISQGVVESNHLNFSGTGFVNYDNVVGSYVQWTVNVPAAGPARLTFRHANGTTTNRPMDIRVNGTVVAASLGFNGTGSWDTWANVTIAAPLAAGTNTIRATATTASGGPNVDYLEVLPQPPQPVRYEAENATVSQGVVESNHLNFSGTGFVNYDNVVGSYVQWTVNAPAAGPATLTFRHANGTTTNRPMDITVDGALVADELAFNGTGSWDTWANVTITASLNAGANTIRATATTANGGPNVDYLDVQT